MKEDATSPTIALESVLLTAMIDAAEGWDVAVGRDSLCIKLLVVATLVQTK